MNPEEFLEKLQEGAFERHLVFHGLVEEDEEVEDSVRFSPGTRCDRWITLPVERIESVDVLRVVPCDDHTHPFVRLELKQPETDEGRVFADLLDSSLAGGESRRSAMRLMSRRRPFSDFGFGGRREIEPVPPDPRPPQCLLWCLEQYVDCLKSPVPAEICGDLFVQCSEDCVPIPA